MSGPALDRLPQPFTFLPAAELADESLNLVLHECQPAEASVWQVPAYIFHIQLRATGEIIGRVSLRIASEDQLKYSGHVGYQIDSDYRGNHYAERAARLVLSIARRHGFSEVWITCNPDNPASQRTIERLGATFIETVDVPDDYPMPAGAIRQKRRYRLRLDPLP
ncbi:MAG TPA: GNAT family N-acetyltransferase [Tepidisphaeraceae bacterium]|nr:GNAT family N-acetyltransferase [Tepidisphaeraceae bacterium]